MSKKIYVLDTNVLLSDPNALYSYKKNDVVLPLKVLEEVDKHKKRQDGVGAHARQTIRILDELREKGSLATGIRLGKGLGVLTVLSAEQQLLPDNLSWTDPDNQIICTALTVREITEDEAGDAAQAPEIVLVSQDINVRVKCDAIGLKTEDYVPNQVVEKLEEVYTGFTTHLVDDAIIDRFYQGEKLYISEKDKKLFPNQYVMLVSNANEKKTALAKFKNYNYALSKVREFKDGVWDIRAKNKEQQFALDMLMDPEIKIVSILGRAGGGKTLIAIAAALQQILADTTYKKLIVSRPVQPMGRDIGFLPGTLEEKMTPWLAPVQDNLEFLMGDDKEHLKMLVEKGTIEMEALTFIRGRSISNAFIIIDEAQNLSMHELKTIVTRVGEDTKIILTGDIEQIDNAYVDATTNGLTYAVEKFKDFELAGHITLQKGERSAVASLAASVL
jgi:PhoH-like ATPase